MTKTAPRRDVYADITKKIISQIETGLSGKFEMPWHRRSAPLAMPKNAITKNHYRGVNVISLWITAEDRGYSSNQWATYKQWKSRDCQVRKGEKAALVLFFKEFHVAPDPSDPLDDGKRFVARASNVFNAAQVDGFEDDATPAPDLPPIERIKAVDEYVTNTGARVEHGGTRAYYQPSADLIRMPDDRDFIDTSTSTRTEGYYSTLLHELTHWTGPKNRCDRAFGKRFGDNAYAVEELVAELGASFLCASLGIENEPREDHARYLKGWLEVMKADSRAIVTAASKASQAVDFLEKLQTQIAPAKAA